MTDPTDQPQIMSNLPEFSVSDLSRAIKSTVEDAFSYVRVRGELSKVTLARSGHLYTDIKDDKAVLNAVCWKGMMSKLSIKPEEGLEVICTGRITTYPGRSNYQLVIDSMELAGQGALLKMLEERKQKLAAEGLFDADRKKPIPTIPRRIGIVTSPTGAVIRDILHRLNDRFPRPVYVWPANMQGEKTVGDVVAGIQGLNALSGDDRPDVIIVARGGGSLEDLMPFNEEAIVRAVVQSDIPVISAIGHETDTTLIDYAADVRAPTPTAAAEIAVPVRAELIQRIDAMHQRVKQSVFNRLKHDRSELRALGSAMGDPRRILEGIQQRFDYASQNLDQYMRGSVETRRAKIERLAAGLRHPASIIREKTGLFTALSGRLSRDMMDRMIDRASKDVMNVGSLLNSLSYQGVLDRGFALVMGDDGSPVKRAADTQTGQAVTLTFADGNVGATIDGGAKPVKKKASQKQSPTTKPKKDSGQGSLF